MKPDQVRLQALLKDTITILCQNSLQFDKELKVQGLLGITVDDENIFIVHVDESYMAENEASVCDQPIDLDFSKEELPDSVTESAQRELCEEDTWKQACQNFEKEGNDFTHESGQIKLNTVYMSDCKEFDGKSFVQNAQHKGKTSRLSRNSGNFVGKMALKQESKDVKTSSLRPNGQPVGHAAKKFSLEERLWASNLSDGSPQVSDAIKIEPTVNSETEFAGQQGFGNGLEVGSYNAVIGTQRYFSQSDYGDPGTTYNDRQSVIFSSSNNPDYKPRRTPSFQFSRPNRSFGRPSNIWKKSYRHQQNALIMTKSFHICGYPDCGKQFHHRRHLLRHQTQKHGRIPTRNFDPTKRTAWPFVIEGVDSNSDDYHIREFIDPAFE